MATDFPIVPLKPVPADTANPTNSPARAMASPGGAFLDGRGRAAMRRAGALCRTLAVWRQAGLIRVDDRVAEQFLEELTETHCDLVEAME